MKFLWATDLHLDQDRSGFLEEPSVGEEIRQKRLPGFVVATQNSKCDGWLITGDIAERDGLIDGLMRMDSLIDQPIYFVLGNHDFYGDTIANTRARVIAKVREANSLVYLTDCGPVQLDDRAFLVGEDGWGDASEGNFEGSYVNLRDFAEIEDFVRIPKDDWKERLQTLGWESARRLSEKLARIPVDATRLIVLTHVPPFCEACWYEGMTTDENWSPFFVCGQVGATLRSFAENNPSMKITVLCGHTHHNGFVQVIENLDVYTGAAAYGYPKVESTISVTSDSVTCERDRR